MQLRALAKRAPAQADAVHRAANWLAERGMPELGRRDPGGKARRVWLVPPHEVLYVARGRTLWVMGIRDSRRRLEPW
jgi:hypothetical protein